MYFVLGLKNLQDPLGGNFMVSNEGLSIFCNTPFIFASRRAEIGNLSGKKRIFVGRIHTMLTEKAAKNAKL